jgi:prepilin-type processing-associated H-X9-DG protein
MITDGVSKTALAGEAVHDIATQEQKGGTDREKQAGSRKDHWWGGSDDIDTSPFVDLSEMLGSTGVIINAQNTYSQRDCDSNPEGPACQALQLSFGSTHRGITQMVFCDGHVEGVQDDIDKQVWSDYGTRASQTLSTGGGVVD